jgi:hypothetical protein
MLKTDCYLYISLLAESSICNTPLGFPLGPCTFPSGQISGQKVQRAGSGRVLHRHVCRWSSFWPVSGKMDSGFRCTGHHVDKSICCPQAINFRPRRESSDLHCVRATKCPVFYLHFLFEGRRLERMRGSRNSEPVRLNAEMHSSTNQCIPL